MNDIDQMLNDSALRYFSDMCTREVLNKVEQGQWLPDAWHGMQEIGLVSAASMETEPGQIGLPLQSLNMLARLAGRFSVPMPIVETYLAQRALTRHGIAFDENQPLGVSTLTVDTAITLTPAANGGYIVNGRLSRVAWGRHASGIVVSARLNNKNCIVLLPAAKTLHKQENLAGEPRDTLIYEQVVIAQECVAFINHASEANQLTYEGALFRCMQITGALQKALEMTLEYAKEREQFGRPIAKFQAIQHQIAEMAAQVASATAAADAAAHLSAIHPNPEAIAMAKIRCSEAATLGGAIAHQVHGAMGFTHEHNLHLNTRRLLSWRDEFGSDSHWANWLGQRIQSLSADELWTFVTSLPSSNTPPATEHPHE